VKQGLVQCATAEQMLAAARSHIESGDTKGALMMAHVLRNRGAELPVPLVRDLASLLRACNEHTLACTTVLEAAQLQSDGKVALELAREAHGYNPRDLGALSFLRTTLLAYLPPESPEIEATTLSLLDGLLAEGDADRVLALAEEIGQIGHKTPAVLVREARALAKKKEVPAAVDTLVQAAEAYGAAGERARQVEAYELALRIDRERKDVRKLVRQLRMTPKKRLVRALTIGATALLLLAMGGVWLSVLRHGRQLVAACTEIKDLLAKADYAAATTALARWQERLGEGPEVQDLEQQVKFAVASAQTQKRTAARKRAAERLRQAATSLHAGDLTAACAIYEELLADELVRPDVETAVEVQFTELAHGLEEAGRQLAGSLPEAPNELSDQRQIDETLAIVRKKADPRLLQAALALQQMGGQNRLPATLTQARQQALVAAATKALPVLRRAADLQSACERLSTRHDAQRRLDPLFRAALDHEQAFAFREALNDYQQLLAARAGNDDLLAHFRTKIADLEAIVRSMEALQRAAADGDATAARQQLGALQRLAPTVPFVTFVRLPITVRTSLPGAEVQWNGAAAGHTPCATTFVPKGRNDLVVKLAGFRVERPTLPPEPPAALDVLLTLQAEGQGDLPATVDQPLAAANGAVFGVDRAGAVFAIDLANRRELWRQSTGDTAGYLSPPLLAGQEIVVASLDGPVRAFDRASGAPRWRRDGLPTEYAPARAGDLVAVATTGGALVLLDGGNEFVRTSLPSPPAGDVLASGSRLVVPLQSGSVEVRDARTLEPVWRDALGQNLVAGTGMLAALQDNGRVTVRELATGNELWHKDLTGSAVGRLCTDGSSLLVTLDDRVVELAMRDGRELWTTARPECGWLDAARFVGRQIAVPTRDGSVLVYGVDRPTPRYRLDGDHKSLVMQSDVGGGAVAFTGRRFAIYRALP
jgi:outer membrane protein assembly factor BamB